MALRSKFHGYWDRDLMRFVEGDPPPRQVYDTAPMIWTDDIKPFRHPATGEVVTTKTRLNQINKSTGCIETAPGEKVASKRVQDKEKIDADWNAAIQKSIAQIDSGMAKLDERTRELCKQQNELVSKALGFDAFNVAGRKTKNGRARKRR